MPQNKIIKKKTKIKSSTYKNILHKIAYYKGIIQNTILSIQKYKSLDIITASDLNVCVNKLQDIHEVLTNIQNSIKPKMFSELSTLYKKVSAEITWPSETEIIFFILHVVSICP